VNPGVMELIEIVPLDNDINCFGASDVVKLSPRIVKVCVLFITSLVVHLVS